MLKFLVVVNYCTASLNETFQEKMDLIRAKIKKSDEDGDIVFFVEDEIMNIAGMDGKARALEELKLLKRSCTQTRILPQLVEWGLHCYSRRCGL